MPRSIQRALITGIVGSGGSYLAEYLTESHPEVEVHGLARWHSTTQNDRRQLGGTVTIHEADLMDFGSTLRVLDAVKPDVVFHLAAHANVHASFVTPAVVLSNNILGTSNLLEAIRYTHLDPIVQMCSSSEVYGQIDPKDVPIDEDTPLRPASPYAVSKVAQDLLGRSYFVSYGMRVIRTRMFTYVNPRRADLFATSFARQIARIEQRRQDEITHGNLDSVRTLIDVRDAMRAYWEAVLWCEPGEAYNIGGPTTLTVGAVLGRLIAMSSATIRTRLDHALLRPTDVTLQIPNVEKFTKTTGWTPRYTIDDSLADLLDYCRAEVRRDLSS